MEEEKHTIFDDLPKPSNLFNDRKGLFNYANNFS